MPLAKLRDLKAKFPAVTANACAKWPPPDLHSLKYRELVAFMRDLMQQYRVDTTCLSAPDETVTDEWLRYFRAAGIVPHIVIDRADTSKLSEVYIGETDHLARASKSLFARP